MPESAIASGCVDFVLSPEEIAQKIVQISRESGDLKVAWEGNVGGAAALAL
jgi:hypothetical protein